MAGLKRLILKERDTGSKGGDRQSSHEGGREGAGTRPSGTGSSPKGGSGQTGGQKSGTVYQSPSTKK